MILFFCVKMLLVPNIKKKSFLLLVDLDLSTLTPQQNKFLLCLTCTAAFRIASYLSHAKVFCQWLCIAYTSLDKTRIPSPWPQPLTQHWVPRLHQLLISDLNWGGIIIRSERVIHSWTFQNIEEIAWDWYSVSFRDIGYLESRKFVWQNNESG